MKMGTVRKNFKVVLLCVGIAAVICVATVIARGQDMGLIRPHTSMWLSQYEGQNMRVTFITVPTFLGTDLGKTAALNLVEAGPTGIVVRFRPSRTVFFPYSEIAAIEPIYNN
jgi:hypothetical protein